MVALSIRPYMVRPSRLVDWLIHTLTGLTNGPAGDSVAGFPTQAVGSVQKAAWRRHRRLHRPILLKAARS